MIIPPGFRRTHTTGEGGGSQAFIQYGRPMSFMENRVKINIIFFSIRCGLPANSTAILINQTQVVHPERQHIAIIPHDG